jgi:hypothetical protein
VTDDAYAAHLARRQGTHTPAEPPAADRPQERTDPAAAPPAGFELAIDPHDPYANGGEEPWEAGAPVVPKLRRIGQGRVRAAAHGLGEWNPYTGRFE